MKIGYTESGYDVFVEYNRASNKYVVVKRKLGHSIGKPFHSEEAAYRYAKACSFKPGE